MTEPKISRRQLALYLGCEAQFTDLNPVSAARTFIARIEGADIENLSKWDVKPILRPLSDISEEEAKVAYNMETLVFTVGQPQVMDYLLSIGIDLFGLIESGLAIDKTKVPSETEAV